MHQISTYVYMDDALLSMEVPTGRLPNPYHDFPFLIVDNVLTQDECNEILHASSEDESYIEASLRGGSIDQQIRKTHIHPLSMLHQQLYEEKFASVRSQIERFFSLSLVSSTRVQVLGYEEGSFYVAHADDSSQLLNASGEIVGFRPVAPERKISTVLFVNDDFEGGALRFNYLYNEDQKSIVLLPKQGTLVAFLSNPYFTHEVCPVHQGYRVTLVQWHDALL